MNKAREFLNIVIKLEKVVAQKGNKLPEEKALTFLQYRALSFVSEEDFATISELGDNIGVSTSSATQIVERLIEQGFLKKERSIKDRRVVEVGLTESGKKQYRKMDKEVLGEIAEILKVLGKKDADEMIRINKKILDKLSTK